MMDFLIRTAYAAQASDGAPQNDFQLLFGKIVDNIVSPVVYLIVALAVVYFVWGVLMFIQNADNSEKRADGYKHMLWGIIGLFIILSAKGIINIIKATLGGS